MGIQWDAMGAMEWNGMECGLGLSILSTFRENPARPERPAAVNGVQITDYKL
jgi:hypothetical protein